MPTLREGHDEVMGIAELGGVLNHLLRDRGVGELARAVGNVVPNRRPEEIRFLWAVEERG